MLIAAIILGLLWLAVAVWFIGAFLAWSGPSSAEIDSELAVDVIERVHVRAAGDVQ